jgi:phage baseplate assembly protein W
MAYGYSAQLPLTTNTTHYDMIDDFAANTRQNFKNLLMTSPGERVMLPDFGVGLRRYLFENDASFISAEIQDRIYEQVRTYMDFLQIVEIRFATADDSPDIKENEMAIKVTYRITILDTFDEVIITSD